MYCYERQGKEKVFQLIIYYPVEAQTHINMYIRKYLDSINIPTTYCTSLLLAIVPAAAYTMYRYILCTVRYCVLLDIVSKFY